MRQLLSISLCFASLVSKAQGSSIIRGILYAPPNVIITLQLNRANDIVLKTENNPGYYTVRFNFLKALPNGSAYVVTVKTAPKGQLYKVTTYAGEAGVVSSQSFVQVKGDYQYDLISRGNNDSVKGTFYESWDPWVDQIPGGNTDWEVFVSQAKGLCGSSGNYRQIFRRNRITNVTQMISRTSDGKEGNGNSGAPVMCNSLGYVAFESYASNLIVNDKNSARDVFLWTNNQTGGSVERVSNGTSGDDATSESFEPTMAGMASTIAFSSSATNIVKGTEVSGVNVYLWDKLTKSTVLISKDYKTGKGVGGSKPSLDFSGDHLAFYSCAYTLLEGDKNNLWDIFLYEKNKPLRRITMAADGSERNQGEESASRVIAPTISGNGKYISYATTASNVVANDNNKVQDVFLYDVENNSTKRLSVSNNGEEGNNDSPYGQGEKIALSFFGDAAFTTKATNLGVPENNIVVYRFSKQKLIPVTTQTGSYVAPPSISYKGNYVAFGCGKPLDYRFNSSGLFIAYIGQED